MAHLYSYPLSYSQKSFIDIVYSITFYLKYKHAQKIFGFQYLIIEKTLSFLHRFVFYVLSLCTTWI